MPKSVGASSPAAFRAAIRSARLSTVCTSGTPFFAAAFGALAVEGAEAFAAFSALNRASASLFPGDYGAIDTARQWDGAETNDGERAAHAEKVKAAWRHRS